jgi:hypothetical protein
MRHASPRGRPRRPKNSTNEKTLVHLIRGPDLDPVAVREGIEGQRLADALVD